MRLWQLSLAMLFLGCLFLIGAVFLAHPGAKAGASIWDECKSGSATQAAREACAEFR